MMAKIKPNNVGVTKTNQNTTLQGKTDRVLSLISSGLQDVSTLANTFATVSSALERRKVTEIENEVKLNGAETNAQKEMNRHNEEMARIENEWKKFSSEVADKERKLSFIKDQIEKFQTEYDRYLSSETKEFLSDAVTSRLESLRKTIMELTKELNKS